MAAPATQQPAARVPAARVHGHGTDRGRDHVIARSLVAAIVARDWAAVEQLLSDDVWMRALLPRRTAEHHGRHAALALLREWFDVPAVDVEAAWHHSVEGREHVGWRLRLLPAWAPEQWHRIEQVGYARVADGRVRRLDLVCTGFHPLTATAAA